MLIKDVMTVHPACCNPADRIDAVARLMRDNDCGEIPVCDGRKIVGVITDRDIATRAVAVGLNPTDVAVSEIMTRDVSTIREEDHIGDALELMETKLVRRLPVIDDFGLIVGIVSQADLVAKGPRFRVDRALRTVSKKTRRVPVTPA